MSSTRRSAAPSSGTSSPRSVKAPKPPRSIVIVGAGDCGTRAALAIRKTGWDGALTLVGTEPVSPYERPPLSKAVLVDDGSPPPITSATQLAKLDIAWRPGVEATAVDRGHHQVVLAGGERLGYDRLLLATGARARRPAIQGPDVVLTLRNLDDALALRARLDRGTRLVVIGGGFIGLEVAATAIGRGCAVTVIEFAHRLMSRVVPAKVAEVIEARHRQAGVDLRCGIGVDRIEPRGDAFAVVLTDQAVIVADVVMAGVGAVPNTELAASAGLTVSNGISVDDRLRSDDPAIFAAGDCCSFPHPLYGGARVRIEAWRNALEQAEVAARNLLGDDAICESVPWFWSDQYELGLQIAGLHAAAAYDVVRRRDDGTEVRFGLDNDGRVVSASGVAEGSGISRDISFAEALIARRATPRTTLLSDPAISLRELVKQAP
jgi:3-phenylpropionate/trans-cinnamate dioxygenase ferredoxin reductase subunit